MTEFDIQTLIDIDDRRLRALTKGEHKSLELSSSFFPRTDGGIKLKNLIQKMLVPNPDDHPSLDTVDRCQTTRQVSAHCPALCADVTHIV